jgi:lipopolysaccharide transport system permease protein
MSFMDEESTDAMLKLEDSAARMQNLPLFVVKPSKGWVSINLPELWNYRELLYFLVWRDIKLRYKQTVLGAAWAVIQPFMTMVVFSIFFGNLAGVPSDGIPYPIFTYTALLPWYLFAHALTESGNSLVNNQQLITKVYIPRLLIPLSAILGGLVDFVIGFLVLIVLMLYFRITPSLAVVTLPLFLLLALGTAFGIGLWLSALNVQYRDVRHVIPFLTQFWLFATPIAYSSTLVPEQWRIWYGLNPMVGVVEGFRWALLGRTSSVGGLVFISCFVVAMLLLSGLVYFQRTEKTFADVV